MAYPKKYRERVIEYIEEGNTKKKAIEVFKVSKSTLHEWINMKKTTGSVEKKELNRKPRKYFPERLNEIIEKTPDAYLSEIAEQIEGGTVSGVHDALKRAKITVKKRRKSIKNEAMNSETNIKKKQKISLNLNECTSTKWDSMNTYTVKKLAVFAEKEFTAKSAARSIKEPT